MSNHLRHCPKHRKPLPCAHCALTAKPAHATTPDADEPPAPVPAVQPTKSDPKPRGGLAGLASQEYRPPRDPTTGKVLETDEGSRTEAQAHALFGVVPPIPSSPPQNQPKRIESYRALL